MASMDSEVSANPLVIVIFSTSDSEQSDPEMQESLGLKLLGMPQKEQAAHYHLNLSYIQAISQDFVHRVSLFHMISYPAVHKEYLRLVFGISVP